MASGEHTHEWKYNEADYKLWTNGKRQYKVLRFCLQCLEVEEVELTNSSQSKGNN